MTDQPTLARYAHILPDGNVWGVSLWDGVTDYTPPEGHTLVALPDGSPVGPGWTYLDGEFIDERPVEDEDED